MDRNETIADIVAEMGVVGFETKQRELQCRPEDVGNMLLRYAERIEAAAKRETVAGNAAKLREAAKAAHYLCVTLNADMDDEEVERLCDVQADLEQALAAPPRNCDVGTAMEQASRHRIFCKNHAYHCDTCPFRENKQDCEFIWGQLPYETPAVQEGGDHAD